MDKTFGFIAIFSHVVEGSILGLLAIWQGFLASTATPITDTDWDRITSQHGTTFVCIVAVIVLWGALLGFIYRAGVKEEKRRAEELAIRKAEDEAKERRHQEVLALQTKNSDELKSLTAEAIKAQLYNGHACETLAKNFQALILQLGERPCQQIKN